MGMFNKAQALILGAAIAVTAGLPMTAVAEGHTAEFYGNKGYVGDVQYAPTRKHRHRHTHKQKKRTYAEAAAASACPPSFYGMYRGIIFCYDGKVMH